LPKIGGLYFWFSENVVKWVEWPSGWGWRRINTWWWV